VGRILSRCDGTVLSRNGEILHPRGLAFLTFQGVLESAHMGQQDDYGKLILRQAAGRGSCPSVAFWQGLGSQPRWTQTNNRHHQNHQEHHKQNGLRVDSYREVVIHDCRVCLWCFQFFLWRTWRWYESIAGIVAHAFTVGGWENSNLD